jgi:hypothetical protein
MMTIRPRHAYAVALLLALMTAGSARPGVPRRPAQPPPPAAPALPAQDTTAGVPTPRHREPAAATPEKPNVPAAAFLDIADTGDVEHAFLPFTAHPLPPLCGARFASGAAVTLAGRMMALYHPRRAEGYIPDDVLNQTIAVYRPGGAARFMRELRAAVAACPVNTSRRGTYQDDARYRLLRAPAHGDEAILGQIAFPEHSPDGPTGRTTTDLFLAVRVGDVVTVLAQTGYESGHADPATFQGLGARAVQRLTAWVRR